MANYFSVSIAETSTDNINCFNHLFSVEAGVLLAVQKLLNLQICQDKPLRICHLVEGI